MSLFPPKNVEEALERLPKGNHPLINDDFAIWYLGECRKNIEKAMILKSEDIGLGYRIMDLNLDEYILMRQTSFYEDPRNNLVFGWVSLPADSIWRFQLSKNLEDPGDYAYWKITNTLPRGKGEYRIVFIESDSDFNYKGVVKRDGYSRRMLALFSDEELAELIGELGGQNRCVEGDVKSFLEEQGS